MSTDPASFRTTYEDSTVYPKQYDHTKPIMVALFLIDLQEYRRIRKDRPEFLASATEIVLPGLTMHKAVKR